MKRSVEYIRWLRDEQLKINLEQLEDIEFFEDGMKLDIPKEIIDEFGFVGLNNIDFIMTDFYKKVDL